MNGFDGMLYGNLSANPIFLDFFNGSNTGVWQGITSAMYQIGGISALPFVGLCVDTWGRRVGMMIGSALVIIGCIINGTTEFTASVSQLMGGRFVLGFGVSMLILSEIPSITRRLADKLAFPHSHCFRSRPNLRRRNSSSSVALDHHWLLQHLLVRLELMSYLSAHWTHANARVLSITGSWAPFSSVALPEAPSQ
jgi:MFS family permease